MSFSEKLIDEFQASFLDDDEPIDKKGERLINTYEAADGKTKEIIDDIFMTLCGWRFQTLLARAGG